MNNYDRFFAYISEILAAHERLSQLLSKKLDAILGHDVTALDAIIKEEQVFVLQSRAFEQNLRSHRDKLGLSGENLREIIRDMDEAEQPRFEELFRRLRVKLDEVNGLNKKCQELTEERIYSIEKSVRSLDKSKNATYEKSGGQMPGGRDPHWLEKTI